MKLEMGNKYLVVNVAPYNPYTGHSKVEPKFLELTVFEERTDANGEFTGEVGTGYLARGSDGKIYGLNYPTVNEGYGDTSWRRYCTDKDFLALTEGQKEQFIIDLYWRDVTYYQCPAEPDFVKGHDYLAFCNVHQILHYKRDSCFYCQIKPEMRRKVEMNMNEHKWVGWYAE